MLHKARRTVFEILQPNGTTFKDKPQTSPFYIKCLFWVAIVFGFYILVSLLTSGNVISFGYVDSDNINIKKNYDIAKTDIDQDSTLHVNDYTKQQELLHSTPISQLPNSHLKSKRLQQLFRYQFTQFLTSKIKSGELKTPSDYQTIALMSELYKKHGETINFVQVGACDGNWMESNDPLQKLLLQSNHWHGVLMEPVPFLFEKLKTNVQKHIPNYDTRIYLLNAALSDTNDWQTFYIVNEKFAKELPHETHALKYQISSFDKQHIMKHLIVKKNKGELSLPVEDYIDSIKVRSVTPDAVIKEFERSKIAVRDASIDLLLIDAEGFDYVILQSFMKILNIRPPIIVYENLHLKDNEKKRR